MAFLCGFLKTPLSAIDAEIQGGFQIFFNDDIDAFAGLSTNTVEVAWYDEHTGIVSGNDGLSSVSQ